MSNKFAIEDIVTRVMPGGFLLAIIYFLFGNNVKINLDNNLDILITFLFFCTAFIVGELLQTIAHEIEWIINIFFKYRRPSKIFLYKNNPVLANEYQRNELLDSLNITKEHYEIFDKDYSKLSILWWKKNKAEDNLSQGYFWKLYSKVSDTNEVKLSNRNYLFARVMMVEFLLISILFFLNSNIVLGIISVSLLLMFLWRSRGIARGLVFQTVLLNLKGK